MTDFLLEWYLWNKAFHLISVIAWMAGLFYLPRLFVYHCQTPIGSGQSEMFMIMERKLLRIIMTPAMLLSYLFGICLLCTPGVADWTSKWIHVKLGLVLLLTIYHHVLGKYCKDFCLDKRRRSERFFRIMNEVPTVLLIGIVIMAIVRPF